MKSIVLYYFNVRKNFFKRTSLPKYPIYNRIYNYVIHRIKIFYTGYWEKNVSKVTALESCYFLFV